MLMKKRHKSDRQTKMKDIAQIIMRRYSEPCADLIPLSKWKKCSTNEENCCIEKLHVTEHKLEEKRSECVEQVLSLLAACISYAYLYDKSSFQQFLTRFDFATHLLTPQSVLGSYLQDAKDNYVYHFFKHSMLLHRRRRDDSKWKKFGEMMQKIVLNVKDEFWELCNTFLTKYLQLRQITLDTTVKVVNHFRVLIEYMERPNPFVNFDILLTARQLITDEFVGCVCFRFPNTLRLYGYEMKHILACPFYSNSLKKMNNPSNMVLSASDSLVLYVIDLMKKEGSQMNLNVYPTRHNRKWLERLRQYKQMYPAMKLHLL